MFEIVPERPQDAAAIETLLDLAFGRDRSKKTVYRFRDGISPVRRLCHVALVDGEFQGSLRFWPVAIAGARKALLLGPLAVDPARRGQAIGVALVRHGLRRARRLGYDVVVLVGDPAYYRRLGFVAAIPHGLRLSGPVEEERFQVRRLPRGPVGEVTGMVQRAAAADIEEA